ncbi:hypothetical protein M422DRAFT_171982, partial [Sphaerobolus stellatus SS14]
ILDAEVLLEICKDISRTIKPTWVASVPANFGSKSHGRLKAAEWHILISLYLPISLGRLWGIGGKYHQTHIWYYQNTMMLVAAVLLATSRQTSNRHAKAYTYYMLEYLHGLKRLFPTMKFRDNHHVALHIEEFLILLGPVHSWWMFPFERLIGRLQKIATNGLVGESYLNLFRYHSQKRKRSNGSYSAESLYCSLQATRLSILWPEHTRSFRSSSSIQ